MAWRAATQCGLYSDSLRTGRLGDRIPVEARFYMSFQTFPRGPLNLLYSGYRNLPRGKVVGPWCWRVPPSSTEVANGLELLSLHAQNIFRLCRKIAKKRLLASSCLVCLSVCPSAWNNKGPSGRILMKLCIWYYFRKFVDKMQMSLKSDKNNGKITRRRFDIYDCLSELLLVWEMFQIKMFWRKNTQSIFHTPPLPRKLYRLWDNVEKCAGAREAADDSMAVRCMLY